MRFLVAFIVIFLAIILFGCIQNAQVEPPLNISIVTSSPPAIPTEKPILVSTKPTVEKKLEPTSSPMPDWCNDTDSLNTASKGSVFGYKNGSFINYTDYCKGDILHEYSCPYGSNNFTELTYNCSEFYFVEPGKCLEGRCIRLSSLEHGNLLQNKPDFFDIVVFPKDDNSPYEISTTYKGRVSADWGFEDGNDWDFDDVVIFPSFIDFHDPKAGSILTIYLTGCNTSAIDQIDIFLYQSEEAEYKLLESGERVTSNSARFTLWPTCHGHINESRSIVIRAPYSDPESVATYTVTTWSQYSLKACWESDGGYDLSRSGKLISVWSTSLNKYSDTCSDVDGIQEFYCDGVDMSNIGLPCPADTPFCKAGACSK